MDFFRRSIKRKSATDTGSIHAIEHNAFSGARKVLLWGHVLEILGTADVARNALAGKTFAFYNSDTATHFIKFGDSSVTAPTGLSDGFPVPPESWAYFTAPIDSQKVIGDSALVGVYLISDDSTAVKEETE